MYGIFSHMNHPNPLEILDLVDENDQVIGSIERNEAYRLGIKNFRVIDAFIRNSAGKLFVPRRQMTKRLFPGCLDASVGGHVISGDSYEETFIKEASEELNLDISMIPYRKLGTMTPLSDSVSAFITVYEVQSDETPNYNPDDFVEHYWLTPEEIIERIEDGDSPKGNLPKILKKFYF